MCNPVYAKFVSIYIVAMVVTSDLKSMNNKRYKHAFEICRYTTFHLLGSWLLCYSSHYQHGEN